MKRIDSQIILQLLEWFKTFGREMPWRGVEDPYKIWISEVMLQQTQVKTVIPYYLRWMEHFPCVFSLAHSSDDEVLKCWEGLGYYRRAKNLLKAARLIAFEFNGKFPQNSADWIKLPGVGPYIAAAVSSIVSNEPVGVVDGNTIRVITRLFEIREDASKNRTKQEVKRYIESGYYNFQPRWVNQAWMEMGALQCTRFPNCRRCPLGDNCLALRHNAVEITPNLPPRKHPPLRKGAIYLIEHNNCLLMVRRPAGGLLNNLWEPPNVMLDIESRHDFENRHGIIKKNNLKLSVSHQYTHFKVNFTIFTGQLTKKWKSGFWIDYMWVPINELNRLARPQVHIKALKIAEYLK